MKYVGLQTQIWRNNVNSVILLILFPVVLYVLFWLFVYFTSGQSEYNPVGTANNSFIYMFPWITSGVAIWFLIAWLSHTSMINKATGSRPLERKENKRVYNIVENLCITSGMKMPKINVIEDDSLNALPRYQPKHLYRFCFAGDAQQT